MLWCAAQANGYADARWATYRQWTTLGAQVRKAERGTLVLFYKELPRGTDADLTDGARFVARATHIFNAAQVDAPPPPAEVPRASVIPDPLSTFDAFVAATGATIQHGGNHACYVPATDTILLPSRTAFRMPAGFAGTLAHELVHWAGAPHRLARNLTGRFGARAYAAEELVGELGAAFVLADLGIARTPHPPCRLLRLLGAALTRRPTRALNRRCSGLSRRRSPRRAAIQGPVGQSRERLLFAPQSCYTSFGVSRDKRQRKLAFSGEWRRAECPGAPANFLKENKPFWSGTYRTFGN